MIVPMAKICMLWSLASVAAGIVSCWRTFGIPSVMSMRMLWALGRSPRARSPNISKLAVWIASAVFVVPPGYSGTRF